MKLSYLLAQYRTLQHEARLANLALAYDRLRTLAGRISRARLRGEVRLQPASPEEERYWPALISSQLNQSVIQEHFADHDLVQLADALAFATGENEADLVFRLEDVADRFLPPLRAALEQAGVAIDGESPHPRQEPRLSDAGGAFRESADE